MFDMAHGTYAEGVRFQSPGFAALPRTLGHTDKRHAITPTGLDNRSSFMAAFVMDDGLVTQASRFVKPRWGLDRVRHGVPRYAAKPRTLGCGM